MAVNFCLFASAENIAKHFWRKLEPAGELLGHGEWFPRCTTGFVADVFAQPSEMAAEMDFAFGWNSFMSFKFACCQINVSSAFRLAFNFSLTDDGVSDSLSEAFIW